MSVFASPLRLCLALIIGLWAPLSCCCAPGPGTTEAAVVESATAPSCHHEAAPEEPDDHPRSPCDGERDCDCGSHVAQARVSPDKPLAVPAPELASLVMDFPPVAMRLFDAAPARFVLHETGPPARPDNSLLALHCMLTI